MTASSWPFGAGLSAGATYFGSVGFVSTDAEASEGLVSPVVPALEDSVFVDSVFVESTFSPSDDEVEVDVVVELLVEELPPAASLEDSDFFSSVLLVVLVAPPVSSFVFVSTLLLFFASEWAAQALLGAHIETMHATVHAIFGRFESADL